MPPPSITPTLPLNNQQALQDAQAGSAAIQTPNFVPSNAIDPLLAKVNDISYDSMASGAAANASVNIAAQQVAAAKAAAAAKNDPSKYKRVPTSDGGFKFYNPDGQEISASEFAKVNQVPVDKVLQDSQNPIDMAFQQDFNQLQKYFSDKLNSKTDSNAAAEAKAIEDKVREQYKIDLSKQSHQQVVQSFMQAYPTVFGLHTTGPQGTNALLPSKDYLDAQAGGGSAIGG